MDLCGRRYGLEYHGFGVFDARLRRRKCPHHLQGHVHPLPPGTVRQRLWKQHQRVSALPEKHRQRRHALRHPRAVRGVRSGHRRQHHQLHRLHQVSRRYLRRRRRRGMQSMSRRNRIQRRRCNVIRHVHTMRRGQYTTSRGQDILRPLRPRLVHGISRQHDVRCLPRQRLHAPARRAVLRVRRASRRRLVPRLHRRRGSGVGRRVRQVSQRNRHRRRRHHGV